MRVKQTQEYKDFTITGCAESAAGHWRSVVLLARNGCISESIPVIPRCASSAQAIEQALLAGRAMVDADGFRLLVRPVQLRRLDSC
jgi:hypothetical protein